MRVRAGIAVVLLIAGACAGTKREQEFATQRYAAPGPGASRYRSEPERGQALSGPHAFRLAQGVERGAAGHPDEPQPDPRLSQLARWVLDVVRDGGSVPPSAVLDFWAHHLGLIEPVPELLVHVTPEPGDLQSLVAAAVQASLARREITHYGGATAEQDGGAYSVLALSVRRAHLRALPRRIEPTPRLTISGKLAPGLTNPQLVVLEPDGGSQRAGGDAQEGFVFDVAAEQPGEYRIELLAQSAQGPTVVANFPLYVGVAPRQHVVVMGAGGNSASDAREVEQRLFALVNRARATAGLPALVRHDELDEVARAHSEDMRDNEFIGHTSPSTGSARDRVERAGIPAAVVQENIGRDVNAEQLHTGLMDSPGHRANILDPQVTHVGIGAVSEPESDHLAFIATEVFIRAPQEIDPDEAPDELLEAINRARRQKGLRPLSDDETLNEIAERAAKRFFSSDQPSQQAVLSEASGAAARSGRPYKGYNGLLLLTFGLEDVTEIDAVLDPEAKGVGIGVAQGSRRDIAQGRIAVALILGH